MESTRRLKKNKKTNETVEVPAEEADTSGLEKNLPEDSFDDTVVESEDDMFDIYKDHEDNEFGHKKYQPEEILVTIPNEIKHDDYLADCMKLKEEILKRKNNAESSIQSLVNALDKTHVDSEDNLQSTSASMPSSKDKNTEEQERRTESSLHIHKHLLASVSKLG
jgi:hypothetical protein